MFVYSFYSGSVHRHQFLLFLADPIPSLISFFHSHFLFKTDVLFIYIFFYFFGYFFLFCFLVLVYKDVNRELGGVGISLENGQEL